jgi:hypothetical protein
MISDIISGDWYIQPASTSECRRARNFPSVDKATGDNVEKKFHKRYYLQQGGIH